MWGIARRQAALWLRRRGRDEAVLASLATDDLARAVDPADAAVDRLDLAEAVRALGAEGSPCPPHWPRSRDARSYSGPRCTGTGTPTARSKLPLLFETVCASVVAIAAASPFGDAERITGQRLPWLRMATAVTLTAAATALAASSIGTDLAGGTTTAVRNLAGLTGLGLLCAALVGGALAWIAPVAYALLGVYALYTQWHGPALTSPCIWPGRPDDDLGGALCAGIALSAGRARDAPPPAG